MNICIKQYGMYNNMDMYIFIHAHKLALYDRLIVINIIYINFFIFFLYHLSTTSEGI